MFPIMYVAIFAIVCYILYITNELSKKFEHMSNIDFSAIDNMSKLYSTDNIVAKNMTITGNLSAKKLNILPKGVIVAWTNEIIPTSWVLCDGSNGTPDLRNRMILGSGGQKPINTIGGKETVVLSEDNLPPHTHEYNTKNEHSQAQNLTVSKKVLEQYKEMGMEPLQLWQEIQSVQTSAFGKNKEFSIMPPCFALIYIMKL